MQLCLLLVVTSMAFTACNKDDDENASGVNGGDLVGRWELTEDRLNGVTDDYYLSGEYIIQFNADGTGQNLIKNISGEEGLRYEGTMNTSNGQTELYNQKGDMTVGGQINTTTGNTVILNKGDGLTVNGTLTSNNDVKVVNKGSEKADVSNATVEAPNKGTKWFWEKLKEILN